MSEFVEVRIHGQVFKLRADAGVVYIESLAGYVDEVMTKISRQSKRSAMDRVAIVAALNIADTLFQGRQRVESEAGTINKRIGRLVAISDVLLKD